MDAELRGLGVMAAGPPDSGIVFRGELMAGAFPGGGDLWGVYVEVNSQQRTNNRRQRNWKLLFAIQPVYGSEANERQVSNAMCIKMTVSVTKMNQNQKTSSTIRHPVFFYSAADSRNPSFMRNDTAVDWR